MLVQPPPENISLYDKASKPEIVIFLAILRWSPLSEYSSLNQLVKLVFVVVETEIDKVIGPPSVPGIPLNSFLSKPIESYSNGFQLSG